MKRNCELLQQAIDKTLEMPTEQPPPSNASNEESSDEEVFEKLKKMTNPLGTVHEQAEDENNESSASSISEIEETNEAQINTRESFNKPDEATEVSSTKKVRRIIESDSETETTNENIDINNVSDLKRTRSVSNSDTETVSRKKSRIIDSDEDE